jgi:hypothetical protein
MHMQGLVMSQSSSRALLALLLHLLGALRQRHRSSRGSVGPPQLTSSPSTSILSSKRAGQHAKKRRKFVPVPLPPPAALQDQALDLLQYLVLQWPSMLLSLEALPQVCVWLA